MLHSVDVEHWNTLLHQRADRTTKCHQPIGAQCQKKYTYPQLTILQFIQEKQDWHTLNCSDRNWIVVRHVSTSTILLLVNIRVKSKHWFQWLHWEDSVYYVRVWYACKPYYLRHRKDWKLNWSLCITPYPQDELSFVGLGSCLLTKAGQ